MAQPEKLISLLRSDARYICGEELGTKAGISRSAVWKQIELLRRYGYSIESRRGLGYKLTAHTDIPVPWELAKILCTSIIGKQIIYRETIDSTQNLAISLASKLGSDGAVVIAGRQESGRGRQKRRWLSPKGGLWLSVILKPEIPTARITILPFAAALAVCEALKALGVAARLKWPNDVMASGKKIAGILLDISATADQVNYVVIGIGINANVDSATISARLPGTKITSISDELGWNTNRLQLTKSLLENLEGYYLGIEHRARGEILQKWKKNSDMLGRKVAVSYKSKTIRGVATDVNEDGSLTLLTDKGCIDVVSGDIRVRY